MATNTRQIAEAPKIVAVDDVDYLKQGDAADILGVDPKTIQRLADYGAIRSIQHEGMVRGRLFNLQDIDNLNRYGVEMGGITLHAREGALSLSRPMKPIAAQCLVARLDTCWATLLKYGMIKGEVAEKIRANIAYAVVHAKRRDSHGYACMNARVEPEEDRGRRAYRYEDDPKSEAGG